MLSSRRMSVVWLAGGGCAGRLGWGEERVDLCFACDELSDAELTCLRGSERDVRVLGEFGPRVEARMSPPSGWNTAIAPAALVVVASELGGGHATGSQSETVAAEGDC